MNDRDQSPTGDRPEVEAFVAGLPKVELHLHLEGSMRLHTRRALAERHRTGLAVRPEGVPFHDFDGFIDAFIEGLGLLRDATDLVTIIADMAADLAANTVRYAEVTTTAWLHLHEGKMTPEAYREALAEGRALARREHGVELAWVIDIPRGFETPAETFTAAFLESPNCPEATVAIGLGGPEIGYPAGDYAASFARAAALGLKRVPHGGETAGSTYVTDCLERLHADRIGHGVMALQDPLVVAELVRRQVPLEVCPTSNVLLKVATDLDNHPLAELRQAGVRVTLATDDPGYFDVDLNRELVLAHHHGGMSTEDLRAMELDSVAVSFLDPGAKARLSAEISAYQQV